MKNSKTLLKLLKSEKIKTIAILGHTSVDPDSIASAYGMKFLVSKLNHKAHIDILIDGISKHTNALIDYYDHEYLSETDKKYDLIIIVDVNVLSQLGQFQELVLKQPKDRIIIIDHHTQTEFADSIALSIIDDKKTSTAELIVELIFSQPYIPSKKLLTILLTGIIYDSRRFYSLNTDLSILLSKILKLGADYDKAVNLIQNEYEESERIARIKCAARSSLHKFNKWLIVWSRIGSFEGSSARGLLDLGADVGIIFTKRNKLTRLSIRSTSNFYRSTEINFGKDIMRELGKQFDGDGGGHSTAAALTIPKEISEKDLRYATFKLLKDALEKRENQVIEEDINVQ
ncbi:MAG: DHH family phosphoesterase [Candidatus Heimdallarchaeota archaeon]|nr:DHH family phosphoesterase [Candidatus Heimdallarchaeota archaeon]